MNEWLDLFIRAIVTGMGAGVGNYLVLRIMIKYLEALKDEKKENIVGTRSRLPERSSKNKGGTTSVRQDE